MKCLFDQLIGYVLTIKSAGIDVVYARGDGLSQNSDRTGHIAWRAPYTFVAVLSGKLHGAIAHTAQDHGRVGKGKCAAEIRLFRHLSPESLPVLHYLQSLDEESFRLGVRICKSD